MGPFVYVRFHGASARYAGGYPAVGAFLPFFTRQMAPGVYDIPKVESRARVLVTTTTPTLEAFDQIKPSVPFVVRLDGTNDKEGRALLAEADLPNVHTEATMLDAARRVVELAR